MNDVKLIEMLETDLRTGGHWLADEIRTWPDSEVDGFSGVMHHWWFQLSRELIRRGGTRPCENEREPNGESCTGTLTFAPGDVQAQCPECSGWAGRLAPPTHRAAAGADHHGQGN